MVNYLKLSAALFSVVILLCSDIAYSEPVSKKDLIALFDRQDQLINAGNGYGDATNESGTLAWAESYLLESYLDMFVSTGNIKYLDNFVRQSEQLVNNTDRARGVKDYKGRSRYGWSATKYSKKQERMIHVAHTGMILYPLVKFCVIVNSDAKLLRYRGYAAKYAKLAEGALAEFESQWRINPATGEGSYWFEKSDPIQTDLSAPMPFNGPLALGRVCIALYALTGNDVYLDKSRALALLFKNNLQKRPPGIWVWGYRPNLSEFRQIEDFSHGAIDVDFAIEACRAGIVFTRDDMANFVKTFVRAYQGGQPATYLDGTYDEKKTDYSDEAGRWLELSSVSCDVFGSIETNLRTRLSTGKRMPPQVVFGLAKLIKYFDQCGKPRE